MLTISQSAAEQIKLSSEKTDSQDLKLRIAAKVAVDEGIEYGMGFDIQKDDDILIQAAGVEVIVAPHCAEHLNGAHLDFVEIEDKSFNFIVQNPNDPNFKPPKETGDAETSK
ncbi:MAG: HesB/IscA family protein [Thiohalomonadales bacterium]